MGLQWWGRGQIHFSWASLWDVVQRDSPLPVLTPQLFRGKCLTLRRYRDSEDTQQDKLSSSRLSLRPFGNHTKSHPQKIHVSRTQQVQMPTCIHNSNPWPYIHTPHNSLKCRFHARRAIWCNCTQRHVAMFKKSRGFHEIHHESHVPLKHLRRGTQKSRWGKFKHLGNQFAINSWLQQVILPLANTLCYRRNCFSSLHPSLSRTHPKFTVQRC